MDLMSRVANASRNIMFGYLGSIVTLAASFISRSVFIYTLGVTYLGVNGLFTSVLSVLSLAELGIGTAMNFSLYKPVALGDIETIKALMKLYRRAYKAIALIIALLGLSAVPFLKFIIKEPGSITMNELTIYYLVFLFNTVSTYFVAYKYSLSNAEQKNYIQTNIHAVTRVVSLGVQIVVLLMFKSFLIYLLTGAAIELLQKIYVSLFFNRMYPYLLDNNVKELTKDQKKPIVTNIKALAIHKIGSISVHQTDNIIISSFINVATVGLLSNYNLIITGITGFINIIFNSVISGFGNLVATESKEKQYYLFKVYRFLGFWLYGFTSIAFLILITPFIQLWIGKEMILPNIVIYLIIANYYFMGHRIVINNFKTAAGIFDSDKYISLVQAAVNLVVSILLVQKIGLPGIFIGTVVQGLISTFTRPFIVFRQAFGRNGIEYYIDSLKYLFPIVIATVLLNFLKNTIWVQNSILEFIVLFVLVMIIPNALFLISFGRSSEFNYLKNIVLAKIRKGRKS